jgi:hypothetical protein
MSKHFHVSIGDGTFQITSPPCQKGLAVGAHHEHAPTETLHVITCINNYVRYRRRYELFHKFKKQMDENKHVILYIVEIAFGDRPFMVTDHGNPRHLQLRTDTELWHKENALNLLVQRLPLDWKYMAWIDADLQFVNTDFAHETIHQLQHYKIVQMFATAANLGPGEEVISVHKGLMYQYLNGKITAKSKQYSEFGHPGFAWAIRREAFTQMGGLIDFAILGAGDHHMALAWIGLVDRAFPPKISAQYQRRLYEFQSLCEEHIKRNVGYTPGTVLHSWHGSFQNRRYCERWQILIINDYNPDTDIKRDWQGLYTFATDAKIGLRDGIRLYFRQRNEDSIDYVEEVKK